MRMIIIQRLVVPLGMLFAMSFCMAKEPGCQTLNEHVRQVGQLLKTKFVRSTRGEGSEVTIVPCCPSAVGELRCLLCAIIDDIDGGTGTVDCEFVITLTGCDEINAIDNYSVIQWLKAIFLKVK